MITNGIIISPLSVIIKWRWNVTAKTAKLRQRQHQMVATISVPNVTLITSSSLQIELAEVEDVKHSRYHLPLLIVGLWHLEIFSRKSTNFIPALSVVVPESVKVVILPGHSGYFRSSRKSIDYLKKLEAIMVETLYALTGRKCWMAVTGRGMNIWH